MSTDYPENDAAGPYNSEGQDNPFGDNSGAHSDLPRAAMVGGPTGQVPVARSRGMASHVPIVSILMIVQGGLEVLMGLVLVALGSFFPVIMQMEVETGRSQDLPPEEFSWFLLVMYGGLGVLTLIAAGLHIFAGIRNYGFRGHVLGIVALAAGMVTMFSCYCAPTTIGLGIYGLITYLNPEATQAFVLGEAGKKPADILAANR